MADTNKTEKEPEKITHIFVPKHEILSEGETEKLLETYGITKKQLPKILKKDPAIKHLGVEREDVIKITRISNIAGKTYYYRVVI